MSDSMDFRKQVSGPSAKTLKIWMLGAKTPEARKVLASMMPPIHKRAHKTPVVEKPKGKK